MKASVGDMEIDVDVSIVKSEPVRQVNRSTAKPASANANASDSFSSNANAISTQPPLLTSNTNSITDSNININRTNVTSNNDVNMYINDKKNSGNNVNNDSDRSEKSIVSNNNQTNERLSSSGDTVIGQQLDKQSAIPGCNISYSELPSNSNSNSLHHSLSEVFVPSLVSSVSATVPTLPSPFLPPLSNAAPASTPAPNLTTGPFSGRITGQSIPPPVIISPLPLLNPRPHIVPTPSPSLGPFSTSISTASTIVPCVSSVTACDMIHIKREREDPLTVKQTIETLKTFNNHPIGKPSAPAPTITTATSNISEEAVNKKNRTEESAPVSGPFSSESVILNSTTSLSLPHPLPTSNDPAVTGDR